MEDGQLSLLHEDMRYDALQKSWVTSEALKHRREAFDLSQCFFDIYKEGCFMTLKYRINHPSESMLKQLEDWQQTPLILLILAFTWPILLVLELVISLVLHLYGNLKDLYPD